MCTWKNKGSAATLIQPDERKVMSGRARVLNGAPPFSGPRLPYIHSTLRRTLKSVKSSSKFAVLYRKGFFLLYGSFWNKFA